jgi:uncharacterized protein involved in exopolysaccharide biosynthesis
MSSYQTSTLPSQSDVDVGAILQALWRGRGWITAVVLCVGLAAYMAMAQMTPMFTSEAHILIDNGEKNTFTRPASGESNRSSRSALVDEEAVASQVQVLLSHDLALKVIRDLKLDTEPEFTKISNSQSPVRALLGMFGLAKGPSKEVLEERVLDAFIKRLEVFPISNSRVINVQFSSADPRIAAQVANRLAENYLKWQQGEKLTENRNASKWLGEQVGKLREKVETSEAAVERFRSKTGLFSGSNNITLNSQQLSELNSQLILAKAQRTEAEARASLITKMLKEKGDVDGASDVLRSALIQRLAEQRVRVQREVSELSATLMSSHPRIKELKSELSSVRQQILGEARKVMKGLQNEAQIAGARETSLRSSLDEIKQRSSHASENEIKLRSLEREAKANRDLLESYLARLRDSSTRHDALSVPAHASVISKARLSDMPSTPKPPAVAALAATGAAIVLLALVVTLELLSSPAAPAAPVPQAAQRGAPYPHRRHDDAINPMTERRAIQAAPQQTTSSETIADHLMATNQGVKGCRVMIAPEYARYDATSEAIALARALANSGKSVVLVDASDGKIGLADALTMGNSTGLSDLINGSATFEGAIQRDTKSAVQLIARGSQPGLPAANGNSSRIFGALSEIYDFVLVYANGAAAQAHVIEYRDGVAATVVVADPNAVAQPGEHAMRQWLSAGQYHGEILSLPTGQSARSVFARAGIAPSVVAS